MTIRVGINGFGRIGRCVTRSLFDRKESDVEIVGINDLTSGDTLAHLLKYDSVHGVWDKDVHFEDGQLRVGDKGIRVSALPNPEELPWDELKVDVVFECTGIFRSKEQASKHLKAGAKRVILSAPAKGEVDGTFCVGINSDSFDPDKHFIVSNASCTTNCLSPIAKVIHENWGLLKGHMVTVHSYTNDQKILDLPHSDLRRARAAALSMIPTSTGAAKAIGLVLPELKGKLDGMAIRVPTPNVSMVCLTAQVSKKTNVEEINDALTQASKGALRGILGVTRESLVSTDLIGNPLSSTADLELTQVVEGDLVEVQSWYDNEWGFSNRMVDLAKIMGEKVT